MGRLTIALIIAIALFALVNYAIDHAYERGRQAMLYELTDVVQYNKELICNYEKN